MGQQEPFLKVAAATGGKESADVVDSFGDEELLLQL